MSEGVLTTTPSSATRSAVLAGPVQAKKEKKKKQRKEKKSSSAKLPSREGHAPALPDPLAAGTEDPRGLCARQVFSLVVTERLPLQVGDLLRHLRKADVRPPAGAACRVAVHACAKACLGILVAS